MYMLYGHGYSTLYQFQYPGFLGSSGKDQEAIVELTVVEQLSQVLMAPKKGVL